MSNASTIILVPFLFAFLAFSGRFYFREGANSKLNPSFLLALGTVAVVAIYLTLGLTHRLPDYGTIGFAVIGLVLLGLSIYRFISL